MEVVLFISGKGGEVRRALWPGSARNRESRRGDKPQVEKPHPAA